MSTHREDRLLIRQSLQNRRKTVPHSRIGWIINGVQASNSTVRRQLKEDGLVAVHCRKRLQFAMAHADWTWVDWSIKLWSDESRFTLFQKMMVGCL